MRNIAFYFHSFETFALQTAKCKSISSVLRFTLMRPSVPRSHLLTSSLPLGWGWELAKKTIKWNLWVEIKTIHYYRKGRENENNNSDYDKIIFIFKISDDKTMLITYLLMPSQSQNSSSHSVHSPQFFKFILFWFSLI